MASTLSGGHQRRCNRSARPVTHVAVSMAGAQAIGAAQVLVRSLVLVRMVAEVPLHTSAVAVLAIRPERRPRVLQGNRQKKQKDRQSPHVVDYIQNLQWRYR